MKKCEECLELHDDKLATCPSCGGASWGKPTTFVPPEPITQAEAPKSKKRGSV